MKKLLGGAGAAIGVKILTGIAVAAAATTVAVAATEVAITGSVNPTNWGHQVTTVVNECKASAVRMGVHGIGQCVSSFARTHGDTVSGGNPNKGKDKTKTGVTGNGSPNPNANAQNGSHGKPTDKSHGPGSSSATTGEPTDPAIIVQTSIPPQP